VAYFADLTPYSFLRRCPPALNVGWLSKGHPYPKGVVAPRLIEKLRELAIKMHVNKTRGFHQCEFCGTIRRLIRNQLGIPLEWRGHNRNLGSAEIWVASKDGVMYAAPDMVIHYIEAHEYLPPAVFLEALEGLVVLGK